MNLETYKQTKRYRVLDSTHSPTEKTREMIGDIFEGMPERFKVKNIILNMEKDINKEPICRLFNKSDLQELTNVIKDGYKIGIGDTVERNGIERIVYDYLYFDGEWNVSVYNKDKEPFEDCY